MGAYHKFQIICFFLELLKNKNQKKNKNKIKRVTFHFKTFTYLKLFSSQIQRCEKRVLEVVFQSSYVGPRRALLNRFELRFSPIPIPDSRAWGCLSPSPFRTKLRPILEQTPPTFFQFVVLIGGRNFEERFSLVGIEFSFDRRNFIGWTSLWI